MAGVMLVDPEILEAIGIEWRYTLCGDKITFHLKLATFELDVMESMGIKEENLTNMFVTSLSLVKNK
ncbi:hypothetical protein RR46_04386 [Papilio xuthus]|uniref:Uncharacterized protein n=1 Tax=Papilio xuthus TaxID=66420 RepID=A0A194PMU9_PAPXU|nr:hypothetical protein RR46_04386 [Papilio xuthus]